MERTAQWIATAARFSLPSSGAPASLITSTSQTTLWRGQVVAFLKLLSEDLRENEQYSSSVSSSAFPKLTQGNQERTKNKTGRIASLLPLVRHFCVRPQPPAAVPGPSVLSQWAFFSHFAQECLYQHREPKVSPRLISSQGSSGTTTCMPGATSNEDTPPKSSMLVL